MTEGLSKETLKPCPFCGSNNVDPTGWASYNPETGESREGPTCDDCDAAAASVAAWNTRAEGPAPPGGGGEEGLDRSALALRRDPPSPSDGPVLRDGGAA